MQIKVENLSYTYSEKSKSIAVKALDGITFDINEGDFFGIVGHTGSGKSTFVQHLNGLINMNGNHGVLRIGEFDLSNGKCDYKKLRSKVGMVFQYPEYQLFAETVFEDVAFGIKNFYPELDGETVERKVKEAVEIVGLNYYEVKDKSPFELSGGQKRRVAIAGVIVSRPEILVLDEPAAGLDPVGKKEFIDLLHVLLKTFVKTVIIVSHDMNIISENCNRVAVFNKGKIYKVGTPKEIFCDGKTVASLGLELPTTALLSHKLKERGIVIDSDLTKKDFVEKLLSYYAVNGRRGGV